MKKRRSSARPDDIVEPMASDYKWIHHLHSPEAWIALVVGFAEILVHEPAARIVLALMLALGITFAVWFRKLHKDPDAVVTLHLTSAPRSPSLRYFAHEAEQISLRVAEEHHP